MVQGLLMLIVEAVGSFITVLLLVRALMRWQRLSFINQIGQFVLAATDWAVRPAQKVFGSSGGFDLSCIVPAWLAQCLVVAIDLALRGALDNPIGLILSAAIGGVFELLRSMLYLIMMVVIAAAVLSWVNPRAPVAPLINGLARPFLLPLQRRLPPLGGVDLSPLVLLLILQMLQFVLMNLRQAVTLALL
ncbi:YggT family protein [Niveibacterium sp. 24ML]|uniref:YggT family protein n=1 Tax=Niveibacterium sp. 24ML TaxID=2985512 RepID=UPI0022716AD1|nr:YggT family protein [Niveibacterium sp. 24ML]MCX9157428.1 YggT family protein [Niveibacterium sp. 24ML]